MTDIHLLELYKEWFRETPDLGSHNRDISDGDINLNLISMTTTGLKWVPLSHDGINERQHAGQANITEVSPSNTNSEAIGLVHTAKESENGITVTINKGVVIGLNRYIKLPLEEHRLTENFDDFLEVDPSKRLSHVGENKMKLGLAMEQPLGPRGARAGLQYKAKVYRAMFQFTMVLEGVVPVRVGGDVYQQQISQILQDLKTKHGGRDDLDALKIRKKKVEIRMEGVAEFRWESGHTLIWQDN